jgi:hypothetical protein
MDLEKLVTLKSRDSKSADKAKSVSERLSLFEAVRRWIQDEGLSSLVIDDGGTLLTDSEILQITNSQNYRDMVLAFDDRR